ncbi:MAG: GNAT family N-acetyltransferase [Chloroflexota bacterium]
MDITIQELDVRNIQDAGQCDNAFVVNSKLILHLEHNILRYTVVPVPPYQKRYPPGDIDFAAYLAQPDKVVFLGYLNRQLAGQIVVRKNWNAYASITDLAVATHFRRQGVGHTLMQHAMAWAQKKQLPGITLETQNNNVAACRLYERCGFRLGGFDEYFYKGINPDTDEIALFWYLAFNAESAQTA